MVPDGDAAAVALGEAPRRVFLSIGRQGVGAGLLIGISKPSHVPALMYTPLPLLLWAAVRFGPLGLASALLLTTTLAIPGVVNGLGPFVDTSTTAGIFQLQLFLLGIGR